MAGFFDKIKKTIGIEEEYYDDYEYDENDKKENELNQEKKDYSYSPSKSTEESINYEKSPKRSNIVNLQQSSVERPKIQIHEPITFDDGPSIVDDILARKVVVLNLEMLEIEKKKQIFDFVSGAIYALKGTIQKVTKDIFVIAPKDIIIDGQLKEQIQSKGFYQF